MRVAKNLPTEALLRRAIAHFAFVLLLIGCVNDAQRDAGNTQRDAGNSDAGFDAGVEPDASSSDAGLDAGTTDPVKSILERAALAVRAASYISFDYSGNGCFDRSILMSAELAAAGIPSNAQFIVPAGMVLLTPKQHPGLEWNFHVAPVIFVTRSEGTEDSRKFVWIRDGAIVGEADRGAYIIDPALYPDEIVVPLGTWVKDLVGQGQSGFLSLGDARDASDPPTNEGIAMERSSETEIPSSLEAMPKLWQIQIGSACHFLSRDAETLASDIGQGGVDEIRRDMNAGVTQLLETMLEQDLLLEVEPIPEYPCWSDF